MFSFPDNYSLPLDANVKDLLDPSDPDSRLASIPIKYLRRRIVGSINSLVHVETM